MKRGLSVFLSLSLFSEKNAQSDYPFLLTINPFSKPCQIGWSLRVEKAMSFHTSQRLSFFLSFGFKPRLSSFRWNTYLCVFVSRWFCFCQITMLQWLNGSILFRFPKTLTGKATDELKRKIINSCTHLDMFLLLRIVINLKLKCIEEEGFFDVFYQNLFFLSFTLISQLNPIYIPREEKKERGFFMFYVLCAKSPDKKYFNTLLCLKKINMKMLFNVLKRKYLKFTKV